MGRRAQFNSYRVIDGVAHLDILDRHGNVKAVALVDEADLPRLLKDGRRWAVGATGKEGYRKQYVMRGSPSEYLHVYLMGKPEGMEVDHLNGNGLDNRRCNLRICTRQENARNLQGAHRRNMSSGVRGVNHDPRYRRPWIVRLGTNGECFHARVTTLNIARITAEMARVQHWGTEAA